MGTALPRYLAAYGSPTTVDWQSKRAGEGENCPLAALGMVRDQRARGSRLLPTVNKERWKGKRGNSGGQISSGQITGDHCNFK